jgi:CRISPR-associated endonuclease Cas1
MDDAYAKVENSTNTNLLHRISSAPKTDVLTIALCPEIPMSPIRPLQFFRVRIVLRTSENIFMHAFHAANLYALLAAAQGKGSGGPSGVPDGALLDAVEQCRAQLDPDDSYAFGLTLLAIPERASATLATLVSGLRLLGKTREAASLIWGGNFRVQDVTDLVAGHSWSQGRALVPISEEHLLLERKRLSDMRRWTLHYSSPFRSERPRRHHLPGRGFLDRDYFPIETFTKRLWDRLAGLQLVSGAPPALNGARIVTNRLFWLDFSYGPAQSRKRMGGVVGRIAFENLPPAWIDAFIWGQYVRTGLNTKFGFGAYRIEELGPEPFACRRAMGLLELALTKGLLTPDKEDVPAGRLLVLAEQMRAGTYRPAPPEQFELLRADGSSRRIAVTPPEDRALQRAILRTLTRGLDQFMEDASYAYRKGLGRQAAARALTQAVAGGYRWAVQADVHQFFDSIDHLELADRLEAYLADGSLVDAILTWVRTGAPFPERGLPTGSPLAPLLANLFLDRFDEIVTAEGGRLIRYADDLLILTRSQPEAERLLAVAQREAAALELALNESKTHIFDLKRPFEFLGFRFEFHTSWKSAACHPPRLVEELGWKEARPSGPAPGDWRFAGEYQAPPEEDAIVIAGPGAYRVYLDRGSLVCGDGRHGAGQPLDALEMVVLLGEPDIAASALLELAERGLPVVLADASLRLCANLNADGPFENLEAVAGQFRVAQDEAARLALARALVAAKLANYATLAHAVCAAADAAVLAQALRELAARCPTAASFDELLGLEGAGGRLWYGHFPMLLGSGWAFPGRVAPAAEDPVNVLLNIAFTQLYRWAQLATRAAGLLPGLGILHRPRAGHAALASDLVEPFRPVLERAVLRLLRLLKPGDFRHTPNGRFALTIAPPAQQLVMAELARSLRQGLAAPGGEPRSYRRHLLVNTRHLARHLGDPTVPWAPFLLPSQP